jgi:hemolysin-activating ACP:hemolysin acyltransferase
MNVINQCFHNISNTVNFYKSFSRYKNITRTELFNHLSTPFFTKQCKIFYRDDKISGFISWAYLDEMNEEYYKLTSTINNWKSGNIVWLVDVLAHNDVQSIVEWGKKYFTNELGIHKKVNYLRMDKDLKIRKISYLLTKEFYNG